MGIYSQFTHLQGAAPHRVCRLPRSKEEKRRLVQQSHVLGSGHPPALWFTGCRWRKTIKNLMNLLWANAFVKRPALCDPWWARLLSPWILQARILEWVAVPFSRGPSPPGIEAGPPALQVDALPSKPPREFTQLLICQSQKTGMCLF